MAISRIAVRPETPFDPGLPEHAGYQNLTPDSTPIALRGGQSDKLCAADYGYLTTGPILLELFQCFLAFSSVAIKRRF